MAVVGAIYAGQGLYGAAHAARTFGPVYMGATKAEVEYLYGRPAWRSPDGKLWQMRDAGTQTAALFDDSGRLAAIGCRGTDGGDGSACPDGYGVGVGMGEEVVWARLGTPSFERYAADSKIMAYPEMGLRFRLRRATVVAVEHRHVSDRARFALRALALLAP